MFIGKCVTPLLIAHRHLCSLYA